MKEILYVMKLDFISVRSTAIGVLFILGIFTIPVAFLFTPYSGLLVLEFLPIILIGPLQVFDGKYGNKLHGVLPVHRKNITRGRFALYTVMFLCIELSVMLLTTAAVYADLNELLPVESSAFLQNQQFAFEPETLPELFCMASMMSLFFWLLFSFFEMTGQIFGKENEMKIFIICGIVVVGLIVGVLTLTDAGILPYFQVPELPETMSGVIRFAVIGNIVVAVICAAFSEITALVVSKREL